MTHIVDEEPCSGCPNCNPDMAALMRANNRGDFKAAVGRAERLIQKFFPRWLGNGLVSVGTSFFPAKPLPPTTNKEKQMRQTSNVPSPPLSNTNDALADPV